MWMGNSWSVAVGVSALAILQSVSAISTPVYLDSYSAQLDYQPDSTKGPDGSWNASFTDSPWSSRVSGQRGGQVGLGVGYHYTTASPNTTADVWVGYTFYGTGIEFFGYFGYLGTGATNANEQSSTQLSLSGPDYMTDNVTATGQMTEGSAPTSLGKFSDLKLGNYTVQLRVPTGTVSFTHLVVQMEVGGE